ERGGELADRERGDDDDEVVDVEVVAAIGRQQALRALEEERALGVVGVADQERAQRLLAGLEDAEHPGGVHLAAGRRRGRTRRAGGGDHYRAVVGFRGRSGFTRWRVDPVVDVRELRRTDEAFAARGGGGSGAGRPGTA